MPVAQSAFAAFGYHYLLLIFRYFSQPLLAVGVINYATHRGLNNFIGSIFSPAFTGFAGIAVLGIHVFAIAQIKQSIKLLITTENYITAGPAVATIRPAPRHVFFPPEEHRSGAAMPS